jgi:hypothetical protein
MTNHNTNPTMKKPLAFNRAALLLIVIIFVAPISFTSCKGQAAKAAAVAWRKQHEANKQEEERNRQRQLQRLNMTPQQRELSDKVSDAWRRAQNGQK